MVGMVRFWRRRRRRVEAVAKLLVALDEAATDPRQDVVRRTRRASRVAAA